jgi:hypothetical protein
MRIVAEQMWKQGVLTIVTAISASSKPNFFTTNSLTPSRAKTTSKVKMKTKTMPVMALWSQLSDRYAAVMPGGTTPEAIAAVMAASTMWTRLRTITLDGSDEMYKVGSAKWAD